MTTPIARASVIVASNPVYRSRKRGNAIMLGVSTLALLFGLFWLAWILGTLLNNGWAGLTRLAFYTQMSPPPGADGGMANAVYGSLLMVTAGAVIGTPVGILAGTYLAEYGGNSRLAS